MQPTIQSQARLKQLAWALSALLLAGGLWGGFHIRSLNAEIARLNAEAREDAGALAAARRDLIESRQSAEAATRDQRATQDRVKEAESARAKAESVAKAADALRIELEAKLKAAEAARSEAEARLKAAAEKEPAKPQQ